MKQKGLLNKTASLLYKAGKRKNSVDIAYTNAIIALTKTMEGEKQRDQRRKMTYEEEVNQRQLRQREFSSALFFCIKLKAFQ